MSDDEIIALKREHNDLVRRGSEMYAEMERMAARVNELRDMIPADDDFVRFLFTNTYEIDGE